MYGTCTYRFIDQNQPNQPNVGKYIPYIDPYRSCGLRRVSFCCYCTSTWNLWTKNIPTSQKKPPGTLPPEVGCSVLAIFWRVLPPSHLLKRRLDVQGMMLSSVNIPSKLQVRHLQSFFSVKFCLALLLVQAISKAKHSVQYWFFYMYLPKPCMFCGVRFVSLNIQSYLFWVCFGGLYWQMNALVLVLLVFVWLQWPCRDFKNTSVPECSSSRMAMEWCLWWWLQTVWNTVSLGFHHH